jgi:hypothetical protein
VRSPYRTTPRLLPSVLGSRPSSRRLRTPRRRLPLPVTASRPPASSRSPRPSPWSRRLQLPVSACHLRLHHHLPRPRPRSSSPPPLRPTKTRSLSDFTFKRLQCSTSACWCDLMEQALQRYALIKHVTDDTPSNDPGWIRMDNVVLNWISNSILTDLHQVVRECGGTARHLWLAIENQFFGNREQRTLHLALPFASLFRATSRCRSTVASLRPWPTVLPT